MVANDFIGVKILFMNVSSFPIGAEYAKGFKCITNAERDGTRAETRIRLSPKRTSPFKSVRASVQSTTGSRGVRISSSNGSNAGQNTFRVKVELYWLLTPFACFPFTSPPVRHHVPPGSERALPTRNVIKEWGRMNDVEDRELKFVEGQ